MTDKGQDWKDRFHDIFNICQEEVKKTTEIGKRMLSASKAKGQLNEAYSELGSLAFSALNKGELTSDDPRVAELMTKIKNYEADLENIEKEVNTIRFSEDSNDS